MPEIPNEAVRSRGGRIESRQRPDACAAEVEHREFNGARLRQDELEIHGRAS